MARLKVGQTVIAPDGRIGRVLFFGSYQVTESGLIPTEAVILFGTKGQAFPIDQLVVESSQNSSTGQKGYEQLELGLEQ